ncbi:hypothetical protein [Paraglaciecola aestuariivivens]
MVVTIFVFACSRDNPATPMCRTHPNIQYKQASAAACLIKHNGQLLALQNDSSELWHLPQQRLNPNLSGQCNAHQAVWKATGLNVEVGQLLMTDSHQVQYFSCAITDSYAQELTEFSLPAFASRNLTQIALIDPFAIQPQQWSEQSDLIKVRQAFTQIDFNAP